MQKLFSILFGFTLIIGLAACQGENGSSGGSDISTMEASDQFPPDAELNPFNYNPSVPANPVNMFMSFRDWTFGWSRDSVTIIAWLGGGMTGDPARRFKSLDKSNEEVVAITFAPDEFEKFEPRKDEAEYGMFRGKAMDGETMLILDMARYVGPYEGEIPSGVEISPAQAYAGGAHNPKDILSAMSAWFGKEIAVHGMADVAKSGDVITYTYKDSQIFKVKMKEAYKSSKEGQFPLVVKGKIAEYDGRNTQLKLVDGEVVKQ